MRPSPQLRILSLALFLASGVTASFGDLPVVGAPAVVEGPPNNAVVEVDRRPGTPGAEYLPNIQLPDVAPPAAGDGLLATPTVPADLGLDKLAPAIPSLALPAIPDLPVSALPIPDLDRIGDTVVSVLDSLSQTLDAVVTKIAADLPIPTLPILANKPDRSNATTFTTVASVVSRMPSATKSSATWTIPTPSASPSYGGTLPEMDKPCFGSDCKNPESGMKYEQVVKLQGDDGVSAGVKGVGIKAGVVAVAGAAVVLGFMA